MYQAKQIERYVDDQFFAFTRDKVRIHCISGPVWKAFFVPCFFLQLFVATTNIGSNNQLTRTITYHPYSDGTGVPSSMELCQLVLLFICSFGEPYGLGASDCSGRKV